MYLIIGSSYFMGGLGQYLQKNNTHMKEANSFDTRVVMYYKGLSLQLPCVP